MWTTKEINLKNKNFANREIEQNRAQNENLINCWQTLIKQTNK